ncbi:unnamed protein product, partial [Polarella glacialis]
ALQADREYAAERWRNGRGLLWFQHLRRAGGTSLCRLLFSATPEAHFLEARAEACQTEDWRSRDAAAVVGHNLTLLGEELRVFGGNAFGQEYGPMPGQDLLGPPEQRQNMRDWVFVTSIREPWSRFWSQLSYEMATCLMNSQALAVCAFGNHQLLGDWWSPQAHIDSVLGVPPHRTLKHPNVYGDNYYMRMLLNRTDVAGPPLTSSDLQDALDILTHRMSSVIIVEDFARSALQLACTLGLDLERAKKLLKTRVRPYESQQ